MATDRPRPGSDTETTPISATMLIASVTTITSAIGAHLSRRTRSGSRCPT